MDNNINEVNGKPGYDNSIIDAMNDLVKFIDDRKLFVSKGHARTIFNTLLQQQLIIMVLAKNLNLMAGRNILDEIFFTGNRVDEVKNHWLCYDINENGLFVKLNRSE